jgi:Family of unknown function (DUF5335)
MSTRPEIHETRELEKRDWAAFFEDINRRLEAGEELEATIEVVTKEIVGPEAERLPLDGITYEDGDDEIAIGVGGRGQRFPAVLWHFVERPARVWALENEGELAAIAIQSENGDRTLLYIHPAHGQAA